MESLIEHLEKKEIKNEIRNPMEDIQEALNHAEFVGNVPGSDFMALTVSDWRFHRGFACLSGSLHWEAPALRLFAVV